MWFPLWRELQVRVGLHYLLSLLTLLGCPGPALCPVSITVVGLSPLATGEVHYGSHKQVTCSSSPFEACCSRLSSGLFLPWNTSCFSLPFHTFVRLGKLCRLRGLSFHCQDPGYYRNRREGIFWASQKSKSVILK